MGLCQSKSNQVHDELQLRDQQQLQKHAKELQKKKPNEYTSFVQTNFPKYQAMFPDKSNACIMRMIADEWRESGQAAAGAAARACGGRDPAAAGACGASGPAAEGAD